MSKKLLPAGDWGGHDYGEPPRWVEVCEDMVVGATADRVFIRADGLPQISFGPKTWATILAAVETCRKEQEPK